VIYKYRLFSIIIHNFTGFVPEKKTCSKRKSPKHNPLTASNGTIKSGFYILISLALTRIVLWGIIEGDLGT
jgi:hypothetical protein